MGLDFHVRQILKKELDIISGRKVVCLCCFHNAVDHCAGPCPGRCVAEQPVLSADSKGADLVLCTVVGDLAARNPSDSFPYTNRYKDRNDQRQRKQIRPTRLAGGSNCFG